MPDKAMPHPLLNRRGNSRLTAPIPCNQRERLADEGKRTEFVELS